MNGESVRRMPIEAIIWTASMLFLAALDPLNAGHLTLCPLKNLGFGFCPGCGLGASVCLVLHGRIIDSFAAHPLGLFAVLVLSARVIWLFRHHRTTAAILHQ